MEMMREISVPMKEVLSIENLLRRYGLKNISVIYNNSTTAIIEFSDDKEYLIFILTDILGKAKEESGLCLSQPDFDFMIRLEKKLKTYSKSDEYFLKKAFKDM